MPRAPVDTLHYAPAIADDQAANRVRDGGPFRQIVSYTHLTSLFCTHNQRDK